MKSMDIKHIGTIATGAVMLGAALAGPVGAGLDTKGLDKGYFYDGNFNPIVQIVVGEKGMATDAVAAGNIAATIGNLAYISKTTEVGGTGAVAEGKVVISTAARGATGDYRQDTIGVTEDAKTFYDKDVGLKFAGTRIYEKGDFTQYSIACDQQTRTEAGLLVEASYDNIHCLFCKTLCLEALKNPSHDMKERIEVDSNKIWYYESGLGEDESENLRMAIGKDAIKYSVETGYIPMKTITTNIGGTSDDQIDFEYRGKMVLFGEEYYVRDIDGSTKIYLSKGKILDGVTSEGYTAEYNGYKFKIDHLIYSAEFQVAGILLNVEKPDGTVVQTQISKMANGKIDNLEVAGVYAEEADSVSTASVIVYDTTTNVLLEDGEDLDMNGVTYKDWRVDFTIADTCADAPVETGDEDCDVSEYDSMDADMTNALLEKVTITYTKNLDDDDALEKGESLNFPNNFKLTFDGYMTNKFRDSLLSGEGAGNIKIERGDEKYQIKVSLTGSDGNRYNNVRLDEGPFRKNDQFVENGVIYQYLKYEDKKNQAGQADDQVEVTFDPQIGGSREKITLDRWTGADVTFRKLALVDALDDKDSGKYESDANITIDAEDLFFIDATDNNNPFGIDIYYDDSDKTIIFSDDNYLTINPATVGIFKDFDEDGNTLRLSIVKEAGVDASLQMQDEKNVKNSPLDLNGDGDDEDILVSLVNYDNENIYIDFTDRNYDETDISYTYDNSVMLTGLNITLDEDIDTLLITPRGDDEYNLDWGADNKLQSVELMHPVELVDATYFIGTSEQETVVTSTVTEADEGKTVTAGCCSFTVDEFGVTAGEATKTKVTQITVNPILGNLVVPEVGADTSKNLIIVGGPSVNGLSTVTKDEIAAASQKFVVKKDGKLLIVAGWEADDTVAAGNALIKWLQDKAHA